MLCCDHRGMNPRLDRAAVFLGDRQQLDRVAELPRVRDIVLRDTRDAFGVDLLGFQQHSERKAYQQAELVCGIVAFDIQRGVRLGNAAALRIRQRTFELDAMLAHRGENRIAGTVDDPVDGALAIAGQSLAKRANNRDTAADARLEADGQSVTRGGLEDFRAMLGQQRLVARDDILARRERFQDQRARRLMAPEELDDNVDVGSFDQCRAVARDQLWRDAERAIGLEAAVGDSGQFQGPAEFARVLRCIAPQQLHHAAADGAASEQGNPYRFQYPTAVWCSGECAPFQEAARRGRCDSSRESAWRMPRIAWRVRCSFSISAKRTKPSPSAPKPTPGDTAIFASAIRNLANSIEPIARNGSGIGAHTNIVALGFSTGHPARFSPSTSTTRLLL